MKRLTLFLFVLLACALSVIWPHEIMFKGLVQPWFYSVEQNADDGYLFGFTLRRVRLKPYGSFSNSISWTLCFGWDSQVARLLDAYIDFRASEHLQFRIGQFTVPGSISSSLTSSGKLDMLERPNITLKWGQNSGLSSYRSVGFQIHGELMQSKLCYAFMVANPKTYGIFTPKMTEAEFVNENNGIAFWGRIQADLKNGLTLGAFFGTGRESSNEIQRNSYGVHLFYVKNRLNLKAEFISGRFQIEGQENIYKGFYALAGYRINKFEPIIRFDLLIPNQGNVDDFGVEEYQDYTLGVNYFFHKNIKFQVNYAIRRESGADEFAGKLKNNIFYVNVQFSF
jgi:phosphate-selective porin